MNNEYLWMNSDTNQPKYAYARVFICGILFYK